MRERDVSFVQTPSSCSMSAKTISVLLLEDDSDLSDVLSALLNTEDGFAMAACADVDECLRMLRAASQTGSQSYDVLLLDLRLARGRSGAEILQAASADSTLRLPPVVVCTALAQRDLEVYQPLFAAHRVLVVPKPFDTDVLLTTLRDAAAGQPG